MQKNKLDMKLILLIVMCVSFGFILLFGYMVCDEISSAKRNCENVNGTYSIRDMNHMCNNKSFHEYFDGTWDFDREVYWNEVN